MIKLEQFGQQFKPKCRYVYTTSWMGLRWPVPSMCLRAPCECRNDQSNNCLLKRFTHTHAHTHTGTRMFQQRHSHQEALHNVCQLLQEWPRKWPEAHGTHANSYYADHSASIRSILIHSDAQRVQINQKWGGFTCFRNLQNLESRCSIVILLALLQAVAAGVLTAA